jgi:transcriptional regulator with XRE-family HTH domain
MTQGMTASTVAGRPARQESFGAELRRWRQRRRVSQLELALRAGTTQRHLSFVETGRSVPGREMVVRLAESLGLPLRERNELLLHAGYAPAYPDSAIGDEDLHAVREALQAILAGHEPYPAMIVNRAGELLLANRACGLFFDDLPPHLLAPPVNTRRVALHPEGLASRIVNFDTWAPHVTDSLQRELRRNPDPRLEALLEELQRYITRAPLPADHLGFAVPLELSTPRGPVSLITTLTTFATATDVLLSELRMEAFLPADDCTAERLRQRAAGTGRLPAIEADERLLDLRPVGDLQRRHGHAGPRLMRTRFSDQDVQAIRCQRRRRPAQ